MRFARLILLIAMLAWPGIAGTSSAQPGPVQEWVRESQKPATIAGSTLTLQPGAWVRMRPAMLDGIIRLRYRTLSPKAEGAVLVRAYPVRPGSGPGVGYRIPLPRPGATTMAPITSFHASVREVEPPATLSPVAAGEWREAEVRIEESRITVTIGGTTARTVDLAGKNHYFAGYAGVEARGGVVEFQNVTLTRLPAGLPCQTDQAAVSATTPGSEPVIVPKTTAQSPKLRKNESPNYTPDAMARAVQGSVMLSAVVGADGVVRDVCVSRGLDPDLDVAAAGAGRAFQFEATLLDGQAVATRVAIEMSFRLKP